MSLAFASLQGREGPLSIFFLPTLLFPSVGSTDRSGNRIRFHSLWQRLRQQQQQRIGSKRGHPRFLSTNDNGVFCCCGFWFVRLPFSSPSRVHIVTRIFFRGGFYKFPTTRFFYFAPMRDQVHRISRTFIPNMSRGVHRNWARI